MVSAAQKVGRHGLRDSTLILMAYRHGLRVSELVALKWEQIDFTAGTIYINRLKHGVSSTHPLRGVELRALRQLQRKYPDSNYLFVSERGTVMAAAQGLRPSALRAFAALLRAPEGLSNAQELKQDYL